MLSHEDLLKTVRLLLAPASINPQAAGGKFGQHKKRQKNWEITETLAYGYSSESTQWELSNEYHYDRV